MSGSWLARAALTVLRHPALWATGATQLLRLAAPGWWHRWPPLPVPDRDYLRFRLQTQYGDPDREPEPSDVVSYLEWCKGYGKVAR